ncbi:MAG: molybdopterin cofactor-binding domain-containing protein, partial [Pseudomonadota bacterium]
MKRLETMRFGVGARAPRYEDRRFVTGSGCFGDDANLPGQLYAEFALSPIPAGTIRDIDLAAARATPGVVTAITADDIERDGLGHLECVALRMRPLARADGSPLQAPPRPALAHRAVRFVGEPVVMVVAESQAAARDAAEAVVLDIEEAPHTADLVDASAPGAPPVWADFPDNTAFVYRTGDQDAVAQALERSAHVARITLPLQRMAMNPMEPRTALGAFDDGRFTLTCGTQNPHTTARELETMLGVAEGAVHLITNDMGGAFGMRSAVFPEMLLVLWAARRLGRPVKWTGT